MAFPVGSKFNVFQTTPQVIAPPDGGPQPGASLNPAGARGFWGDMLTANRWLRQNIAGMMSPLDPQEKEQQLLERPAREALPRVLSQADLTPLPAPQPSIFNAMNKALDGSGEVDLRELLAEVAGDAGKSTAFLAGQVVDARDRRGDLNYKIMDMVKSDSSMAYLYMKVMENAGPSLGGRVMGMVSQDPTLSGAFLSTITKSGTTSMLSMVSGNSALSTRFSMIQASASSSSDGMAALTEFNKNLSKDSSAAGMVANIQANAARTEEGKAALDRLNDNLSRDSSAAAASVGAEAAASRSQAGSAAVGA